MKNLTVYFDGAATLRHKGGYGFFVIDEDNKEGLHAESGEVDELPSRITCNVAEHYALTKALMWLIENDHTESNIRVYGDSKLIIGQIFKGWTCKNKNLPYAPHFFVNKQLIQRFKKIKGEHIPRERNYIADDLAKQGKG